VRDNQGQLLAEYVGSSSYYLFDGQGNTAALIDGSGTIKNSYSYEPYGNTVTSSATVANPYRFGGAYGAYTDDETSLIKIGARYYDPQLGRWTQQDLLAGKLMSPQRSSEKG
jgi:RHS repeat-associated protein